MLSIGKLGQGQGAADYFLRRKAGCELDYYTGDGERAGVWCGNGLSQLGLTGELDATGELAMRELLAGRAPDGTVLVKPVWRTDPGGKLPARDILKALHQAAVERGVDMDVLLRTPELLASYERLDEAMRAARRRPLWPGPAVPAQTAVDLLTAAGLDAHQVLATPRRHQRLARALLRSTDMVDVRLPGLDVCLSAPKSVSILYGVADPATSAAAIDAHRTAVAAALDYLERTCTQALRGHHGGRTEQRIASSGLIGAAFEHRTSRLGDPQVHTHVVLANLLRGVDGKWGALDTREIYAQARTAGFVYQAVLRGELTRTLGVGWQPVRNGQAEIADVDRGLLKLFSQRRTAIEAELERTGRTDPKAAQHATLVTRPAKPQPVASLRDRWVTQAQEAGFEPSRLGKLLHRHTPPPSPDPDLLAEQLVAGTGLTLKRPTFDRRDVLRAVCETLPAGATVSLTQLRALATAAIKHPQIVPLLPDAPVRHRRYSTSELLTVEGRALRTAKARLVDGLAVVSPAPTTEGEGPLAVLNGLSTEQQQLVLALTSSGAGVQVVVGPAGSGKTAALAAARQIWNTNGIQVRGTALAAIAARVLEHGSGIPACSLHRLLQSVQQPGAARTASGPSGIPAGGVLVVDEAGMVGTRMLAQLIDLTAASSTKLVLVGDPHQLPEIDAGGLFAALANKLPAVRLVGNQRQQQPWEQSALARLRDGDVLTAVQAYADHDRLRIADDIGGMTEELLADYRSARQGREPGQVLIVTGSRCDARRLNQAVRDDLVGHGELSETELLVSLAGGDTQRSYRAGEQVIVTANDYHRGLLNGTRGQVTAIHPADHSVTVRCDDGRELHLENDYLRTGRLAHGYALTAHKAQGMTVDISLLWGSAALTRETGYVALSRGREANYLYATWDTLRRDTGTDIDRPRTGTTPSASDRRALTKAALVERLDSSGRQQLARSWWRPPTRRGLDPRAATTSVVAHGGVSRAG